MAFLDADDMLYPESIMDRIDSLSRKSDDGLIVGSYCGTEIGSVDTTVEDLDEADLWNGSDSFIDFLNGSDDCPFPVLAPLLYRDVVLAAGGFDESMVSGGEDWDLWQRLLRAGFLFIPATLKSAVYRQRPDSMTKRLAVDHVRQSSLLLEQPYQSMVSGLSVASKAPFPMPVDHYRRALLRSRRAIRFGAMALVAGDLDQYTACIRELDPTSGVWLSRHVEVQAVARDGIRRALGLTDAQVERILSETRVFEERVTFDVGAQTSKPPPSPPVIRGPEVEYLLAPLNSAQLESMIACLDGDIGTEVQVGVLLLDRLAGDQGVYERARSHSLSVWSLNDWVIQNGKCRTLVVGAVRETVVSALVSAVHESGGVVIEVEEPGAHLMVLPEARREQIHRRVKAPDSLPNVADNDHFALRLDTDRPGSEWDTTLPTSPDSSWQVEENTDFPHDAAEIGLFKNRHRGERVVIIGNGPSLNQLDLRLLAGIPTIAVNAIFLASDRMGFDPTYYVVEDTAVMRDNLDSIRDYKAAHRFFPSMYRDQIAKSPDTSFFRMNTGFYEGRSPAFCVPRFSTDASQRVFSGQSVTIINLQIAYYMGFSEVILIGMDFSYTIPKSSIVDGNRILSQGDDPNHFHPDYFGKGKVWKDPKLDRVLANYQLAKLMFEADGRRIVNATVGGRLEIFDRVEYEHVLSQPVYEGITT